MIQSTDYANSGQDRPAAPARGDAADHHWIMSQVVEGLLLIADSLEAETTMMTKVLGRL